VLADEDATAAQQTVADASAAADVIKTVDVRSLERTCSMRR
jgi:hypothetical protein